MLIGFMITDDMMIHDKFFLSPYAITYLPYYVISRLPHGRNELTMHNSRRHG